MKNKFDKRHTTCSLLGFILFFSGFILHLSLSTYVFKPHREKMDSESRHRADSLRIKTYGDYSFSVLTELYKTLQIPEQAIIFLGNSLIQDYNWNELDRNYTYINRGIRGATTKHLIQQINEMNLNKPKAFVVLTGTNEMLMNLSTHQTIRDLDSLSRIMIAKRTFVIWNTIPYVGSDFHRSEKINSKLDTVNAFIRTLGMVKFFEIFDLNFATSLNGFLQKDLTYDNIHLNWKGYQIWADSVRHIFQKRKEDL
jgi:lysophospholipase L1-like esterase